MHSDRTREIDPGAQLVVVYRATGDVGTILTFLEEEGLSPVELMPTAPVDGLPQVWPIAVPADQAEKAVSLLRQLEGELKPAVEEAAARFRSAVLSALVVGCAAVPIGWFAWGLGQGVGLGLTTFMVSFLVIGRLLKEPVAHGGTSTEEREEG